MKKVLLFLFCFLPFFLENHLIYYEPYNYFILLIVHVVSNIKIKKSLFSPSSLFIIYITLNYSIGSFLYNIFLLDDYLEGILDDNLLLNRLVINNLFIFFAIIFSDY